jgi:hypothetical protein
VFDEFTYRQGNPAICACDSVPALNRLTKGNDNAHVCRCVRLPTQASNRQSNHSQNASDQGIHQSLLGLDS